jgi:allantoate deiminase/N-carbamoyl-L-amino-acid hydrolase
MSSAAIGGARAGKFGERIVAMCDRLAEFSETPGALTCTYLMPAHTAAAAELRAQFETAGLDTTIDAVGNVVGRLASASSNAKTLILASHYDTVVDAGRYDGRLGVTTALAVAEHLRRAGRALPFRLDVIAFSEEEGVRFATPYIGSSALAGRFDMALLQRRDADGNAMIDVMRAAGHEPDAIPALARRSQDLLGYIEVHIEQGPVLLREDLPVGIVTAIAGAVRHNIVIHGTAGHAGTVPMQLRHDAAAAAAEIVLAVERRCTVAPTLVGTVGRLAVPNGAINVIPGRCELSLDVRASNDAMRDAAVDDILGEIKRIADQRGVKAEITETLRNATVPCSPRLQALLAEAIARHGIKPRHLPSGAGHDGGMFDGLTDVAMLFVRCGNGGISHSPLETVTMQDVDIAARILLDTILHLAGD